MIPTELHLQKDWHYFMKNYSQVQMWFRNEKIFKKVIKLLSQDKATPSTHSLHHAICQVWPWRHPWHSSTQQALHSRLFVSQLKSGTASTGRYILGRTLHEKLLNRVPQQFNPKHTAVEEDWNHVWHELHRELPHSSSQTRLRGNAKAHPHFTSVTLTTQRTSFLRKTALTQGLASASRVLVSVLPCKDYLKTSNYIKIHH